MASFINKLITAVEVIGAVTGAKQLDSVANSTDNVTKASTRLSNESSNSARGFAAQSKGLGGLVASYAGAAANIFAITQAYSALNKAARIDQVIEGTKILASQVGETGSSILANMKDITNGQLSMAQSAEQVNSALSAGFDSKQIAGLTEVAFKASRVLGRDLTDSVQRLIKGTAKLEPELLDELGIFTRLEPAVDKYASKLGVTAASLTEFQRRQAFANAAIDEGNRKFGLIQVSATSTQAVFEKTAASFADLAQQIGSVAASTVAPVLEKLTANAGTSFLAIGAIGFVVFNKLFEQIGSFVTKGVKGLEAVANSSKKTQAQLEQQQAAAAAVKAAEVAQQQATGAAAGAAGTATGRYIGAGGIGTETKSIMDRAKTGSATNTQMEADVKFIKEKSIPAQKAYIESIKEGNRTEEAKAKAIASAQSRITALNIVQESYVKAAAASSDKTQVLTAASSKLSTIMGVLAGVMSKAGAALNWLATGIALAQIIGTIFDKDILGGVVELWNKLTESSKNLKSGIEGISVSIMNANADKLSGIFNAKELEQVNKEMQGLLVSATKVDSITLENTKSYLAGPNPNSKYAQKANKGGTTAELNPRGSFEKTIPLDPKIIEDLKTRFEGLGFAIETTGDTSKVKIANLKDGLEGMAQIKLVPLIQRYAQLTTEMDKTDPKSDQYKKLQISLAAVEGAMTGVISRTDTLGMISGKVASITELASNKVSESIIRQGYETDKNAKTWSVAGVAMGTYVKGQADANKMMTGWLSAATKTESLTNDINTQFSTAGATSEYLSKSVHGAQVALAAEYVETIKVIEANKNNSKQQWAVIDAYAAKRDIVDSQVKSLAALVDAERITKNIEKQFSAERQAYAEAVAQGYVNANGKIATSDTEVSANRMQFLTNAVDLGNAAAASLEKLKMPGGGDKTNIALWTEQVKAGNLSIEASVGAMIKMGSEIKKTNEDLHNRLRTLNTESAELALQDALAETRRKITSDTNDFARADALRQSYISNVLEIQVKQTQARIDASKSELSILNTRLSGEQAVLEAQQKQVKAASDLAIAKAERQGANAIGPLKSQEVVQQALPDLYSTDQKVNLQAAIAKQEYDNALRIINLKAAAEQADYSKQLSLLAKKQEGVQAEIEQKKKEIEDTRKLQQDQNSIIKSNMEQEVKKLEFDRSQIPLKQQELKDLKDIELLKITNTTQAKLDEMKLIAERVDLVYKEAEVFKAASESNTAWVNKFVEAVNKQFGGEKITALTVTSNFDSIIKGADAARTKIGDINTAIIAKGIAEQKQVEQSTKFSDKQYNKDIENITEILAQKTSAIEAQKKLQDGADTRVLAQLEADKKNAEERLAALKIDGDTIGINAAASAEKSQAEREAIARTRDDRLTALAIEKNTFLQLANSLAGIVKNNLNKGVDAFYDAIRNGTLTLKSFREGVVNVFKDILFDFAKEATKKLLITPITDAFTSSLGKIGEGIFGDLFKTGKDAATGAVAGATTGTCGCVGDALTKAVPAIGSAAGAGAGEIVAKAGAGAVTEGVINKATASSGGVIDLNTKVPATTPAAGAVQAATPPVVAAQTVTPPVDNLVQASAPTRGIQPIDNTTSTLQDQYSSGRGANWSPATPAAAAGTASDPLIVAGTGTGGALSTDISSVAQNATMGNIGTFGGSTGFEPRSLMSPSTWGGTALQPTTDQAFGALGPTGNSYWNANNQGWNPGEAGQAGQSFSTQFGGSAPLNLGAGGSGQFTTQQFTGSSSWSLDAGGKMGDRAAGLDPKIIEDFNTKVSDSSDKLDTFGINTNTGADGVQALANQTDSGVEGLSGLDASLVSNTVSLAANDAITKTKTLTDTADLAQKEIAMIADEEETLETGVATTNLVAFSGALSTAASAAASGGAVKAAGAATSGGGGLLSGLFGSFFASSGGLMNPSRSWQRFAGGGSKKRDSIPALLEPGEFVIRKDATKKLGQNVLERMNATGKISDTQDKLVSNVEAKLKDLTKSDLTDPNSVKQLDKTIKLLDKTTIGADPSQSSSHTARLYGAGMKRFASGGGVKKIDSVPALLQPGEFVMKKSAVDAIGSNNLERMNSAGKSTNKPTNIKVQLENSGKEKEAEQGETQFDGETAIVKIILKDLSSNGPIRRSMRGM